MVALLPLAIEPQPAFTGLFRARDADDVADLAMVLGTAVLRGDKFAAFTADEPDIREHVLEALADGLAEHGVELEFRDPSEIYRLTDGLDPATHATSLAVWSPPLRDGQAYGRRPLFVIEHAELLRPQTIEFLWLAATVFLTGPPAPQILFLGDTRFQDMLRSDACRGIRDHIVTNLTVASGNAPADSDSAPAPSGRAAPLPAASPAPPAASPPAFPPARARRRSRAARFRNGWIGAGAAVLLAGAAGTVKLTGLPSLLGPQSAAPVAAKAENRPTAPAPHPPAPPATATRGSPDVALPSAAPPHPAAQPAATPAAQPPQAPQSQASAAAALPPAATAAPPREESGPTRLDQSHVVVLFRAGSEDSQAYAREVASSLDGRVASVATQAVPALPRVARIHFASREDRHAAMQLNAILAGSLGKIWVHRQTGRQAAPDAGTIEIQLPQQARAAR